MSTTHPWDRLPSMLLVLDAHGQARQANRAFVRSTGQTPQEALRDGWRSAFTPASREALLQQLAAGGDFALQLRMRVGQHETWVDCAASWQPDTAEYVCLFHDVSTEKNAELSARSQAELFRLLADSLPVLIAYYEAAEFRCMFANRRYAQTFGLDPQGIIGKTNAEVIGAEAAAEIQHKVDRMLIERVPIAYERQAVGANGASRWLDVQMLPHVDAGGRSAGAFVLITDITRRRLGEQALRESEDRLSKFMQASAEGILFHKDGVVVDVNPPLAHLIGYPLEDMRGKQALAFVAPTMCPARWR